MIISKNPWTHGESLGNWRLRRAQKTAIYTINQYKVKLGNILHLLDKYKAIISLGCMLIFQFSLYDYNYAEYINFSLM